MGEELRTWRRNARLFFMTRGSDAKIFLHAYIFTRNSYSVRTLSHAPSSEDLALAQMQRRRQFTAV